MVQIPPARHAGGGNAGRLSWNRFTFSTKWHDPATGLHYYGYRWYDPVAGRWPSRDPFGDKGPSVRIEKEKAHGDKDLIYDENEKPLTPQELLDKVKGDPDSKKAKKVKLWCCEVGKGENSFAERFAKLCGKTTYGSNEIFWESGGSKGSVAPQNPKTGNRKKNPFMRIFKWKFRKFK